MRQVAAIVATSPGRETELLPRALRSIAEQAPGLLAAVVVVDDAPTTERLALLRRISEDALSPPQGRCNRSALSELDVSVLSNARTRGWSGTGAWNTAADWLRRIVSDDLWLAFLDDDDEWLPSYISTCWRVAGGSPSHSEALLVASGLVHVSGSRRLVEYPPNPLRRSDLLQGGVGIKGSNLCVSSAAFHAVEGFDESLPSETDRDLLLRLLDLADQTRAGILHAPGAYVLHHEHDGRRVTTDPAVRAAGAKRFAAKHAARRAQDP